MPLGLYTVSFEKYGMATVELSLNASAELVYEMDQVVMIPGLTTEPISLTGKVYNTIRFPDNKCRVEFVPYFDWGYTRTIYTNEEGIFTIPSMIAGMYRHDDFESHLYTKRHQFDVDLSVGGVSYDIGVFELEQDLGRTGFAAGGINRRLFLCP